MEQNLLNYIESIPDTLANQLLKEVSNIMDRSGMFYRAFSRKKTSQSIDHKFSTKKYNKTHKMQDLFGVRIALYFKDDISVCEFLIKNSFHVVDISADDPDTESFKPVRLNYVCKLPQDIKNYIMPEFWDEAYIDDTFEIQIRTVFSEGWHEIEHDLRYKCKQDWNDENDMNRALNGIFATLETCDWSIISMFDQLAYKKYKCNEWSSMLRNKLRLRTVNNSIGTELVQILDFNHSFAKELLKINRSELIALLSNGVISSIPKTLDNIIFISNEFFIDDEKIREKMPSILRKQCQKAKAQIQWKQGFSKFS